MEGYGNENPGAFQPTRPLRGATVHLSALIRSAFWISTHAPLAGRDSPRSTSGRSGREFQPTRPLRGATSAAAPRVHPDADFNPRAPCGARLGHRERGNHGREDFNPRAPCGARPRKVLDHPARGRFQPTRPLRGATWVSAGMELRPTNFNPRAPCGARQLSPSMLALTFGFQPTRPLRGATLIWMVCAVAPIFQPTRPLRGATATDETGQHYVLISTHAPLAGRDRCVSFVFGGKIYFNPRAPCGARRS